MGTRTEKLHAARDELRRAPGPSRPIDPRGMTRATERETLVGERDAAPAISYILGIVGLLLVALAVVLVLFANRVDWHVSDGVVLLMAAIFIGGIALAGFGSAIRILAARRR
jgi:hypothetical protein